MARFPNKRIQWPKLRILLPVLSALLLPQVGAKSADQVEIRRVDDASRVDVLIDGALFTSYRYGSDFVDKPVFYPLLTASGNMVNRGYPMREDIAGESRDHPHQQSLFFAYGDVEGVDFWTHQPDRRIVHREIQEIVQGSEAALTLRLAWIAQDRPLLEQIWRIAFRSVGDVRWMDHDITLTALDRNLRFGDTKEGLFALRVAAALCEQGGSGHYFNSNGEETSAQAWGRKADWVALRGRLADEEVTVAMFDHPDSLGHPTRWHARDYGLFAANPLGTKDFDPSAGTLEHVLKAGLSDHFRYRVAIYSGHPTAARIERDYRDFADSK